ncbi:hypothetical protein IJ531_04585, partial [bacterium]|nr:hypothetical protein [bacterium]
MLDFKDTKFKLRNIRIICDELLFNLYDENIKKNFRFDFKKLVFTSSDIQKPVTIQAQGAIYGADKISDIRLNIEYKMSKGVFDKLKSKIVNFNYNPLIYASRFKFYTKSDINLKINPKDNRNNVEGYINFSDFNFVLDNIQIPKNNLSMIFKGEKIKLSADFNLIKNQFIKLNSNIDYSKNKNIELKLNSNEIDLADFKKILNALVKIFNLKYNFDEINIEGTTSADVYLKSNFKTISSRGFANIKNAKLTDKKSGLILNDINSNINFENNKINIQRTTTFVDNSKFHLEGDIDNKTNLNLKINSDNINIAQILNTIKHLPLLSRMVPELNDYSFKSGFVKINAQIKGTLNNPVITTHTIVSDFKVLIKSLNTLIQSKEILLDIKPEGMLIKDIYIRAKNNIISCMEYKILNPDANLKLVNNDIIIDKTQISLDNIKAQVSGVIKNYSKDYVMELNLNTSLPLDNGLIIIKNKFPKINADIVLDKNKIKIVNADILDNSKNILNISGNSFEYLSDNPRFDNLKIALTDRLSFIIRKADNLSFEIFGNINISGNLKKPYVTGAIKLYNVICKKINLFIQDCDLLIKNSNLEGNILSLDILETNLQDVKFEGSLDGDILNIKHFSADIFQGKIEGKSDINIRTFKKNTELILKEISVRHLSSYLKQYSIAASGRLSALSRLSFTGLDYTSAINSLQGYIKFNIDNGELAQFAKLERFLQAGNILSQSILKLTLNSIISSVTKQNTGDFKTIEGTVKINSPMAEIQYINTRGTNMSMHIEGRYNIINNHAILRVLGRIPLNIVSVMGNIGNFSLSQLFDNQSGEKSAIEKMMSVYMSDDDRAKIPELANYQQNSPTREFIV